MALNVELKRRRFTVEEYVRMIETGILGKYDRAELIQGEVVEKVTIGSRHAAAVAMLHMMFVTALGHRAQVRSAGLIRLLPDSAPEPDVVLLRWRDDFYRMAHPAGEDVMLAVEVSETSLRYDRTVKLPLYARAGIREAWIVNLEGGVIEVYRGPTPTGYTNVGRAERGGHVTPGTFPDVALSVTEILG